MAKIDRLVVDCKDGVTLEVIAREPSVPSGKFVREIEIDKAAGKRLTAAMKKAFNKAE